MADGTAVGKGQNVLGQAVEAIFNQGRLDMVEVFFHPDFRDLDVFPDEPEGTRESFSGFIAELRGSLPDLRFEALQEETVVGDQIWGRYMASGTMTGGPFLGKPATGKSARWRELHWVRVDAATGQIIEHFGAGDDLGMMHSLGLMDSFRSDSAADLEQ